MLKKFILLLSAFMCTMTIVAQTYDRVVLDNKIILSEDFSKFTAGSEDAPDGTRLDDAETSAISNEYFNAAGWTGIEIYQAGGCAYMAYSEQWEQTGQIMTPFINTSGAINIKCRMRSVNPDGDFVGYSIADANYETLDSYFTLISNEWTEVSWITSAGDIGTRIILYSYDHNVFIDDIEISSCNLDTPELLPETNIGENFLTINWNAVERADVYYVNLYAEHTAKEDETYYYTDSDFSFIYSNGSIVSPDVVEEMESYLQNGWHVYMPAMIEGAIGVTGQYSDYGEKGAITSPVYDFSSNGGIVSISFKAYGNIDDEISISLFAHPYGYYDIVDQNIIKITNEGWNEYSFDLYNGMTDSYIEIKYLNEDFLFIDDIKLSQNINKGEFKVNNFITIETSKTYADVFVEEKFLEDDIYYQVNAAQYVWGYDYHGNSIIIESINSEKTEPKYIFGSTDVESLEASKANAYFTENRLNVINPDEENVSVYNINGVCVYKDASNGSADINLPKGVYIVMIGEKIIKTVNY